jgi:hypothetical protein
MIKVIDNSVLGIITMWWFQMRMDCLSMYILVLFHQWTIIFPNCIQQGMIKQAGLEVTLQACIQEVLSFNLARTLAVLTFLWFSSASPCNASMVPELGHGCFLPNPFQFISYPTIWCIVYILTATLSNTKKTRCVQNCNDWHQWSPA